MVGLSLQLGVLSNLLGFPWEICRDYMALLWFIISTLFLTHKACIILCLPSATDHRKFHHQSKHFKMGRSDKVTKAQSATVVIGESFMLRCVVTLLILLLSQDRVHVDLVTQIPASRCPTVRTVLQIGLSWRKLGLLQLFNHFHVFRLSRWCSNLSLLKLVLFVNFSVLLVHTKGEGWNSWLIAELPPDLVNHKFIHWVCGKWVRESLHT